ncbi:hypothetical protein D3C85_1481410 [compost metagenome]
MHFADTAQGMRHAGAHPDGARGRHHPAAGIGLHHHHAAHGIQQLVLVVRVRRNKPAGRVIGGPADDRRRGLLDLLERFAQGLGLAGWLHVRFAMVCG